MRFTTLLLLPVLLATAAAAAELLQPGAAFPSWELSDQTGATVASRDLAGKTYLLWFYPKAMTAGCTAEGDGLRDQFAAFQARGVEILGVSFDSPADNATFVREQAFPFRLLSDQSHTLAVAVGAAKSADQPVARRISYVVGPDGKVVKTYAQVTPARHASEVLADLPAATPAAR
jgi:peroxiredoxin Q/BCP